jgi:four helix bundle protein
MRIPADLRARTKAFASEIVRLFIRLPRGRDEVRILGAQMRRSGTSVAAHTREASRARSDAEFCSRIDTLLQEADETQLWLDLLREDGALQDPAIQSCHAEADELLSIFTTIVAKIRKSLRS